MTTAPSAADVNAVTTPLAKPPSLATRCVAETVGTFLLTVAALLSPPHLTFAIVGATLLVMVLAIGKVSGSHINPAVTVGLVVVRKFPLSEGVAYFAAQVVGAFLALGLGQLLDRRLPETDPAVNATWFEMLGTALFVFVVVRVVLAKLPEAASALGIGVALLIGIAIAGPSSGGVLNPAIATVLLTGDLLRGQPIQPFTYLLAPLIAAVTGALLAFYLSPEAEVAA
ncbi:aquaporin [Truepera radiovictrix]|uniref:Major intrinsic protein n=1 Tax=Truepera radiovictrix (strain DSM 17093 / CIP 108686 / LMG 22925 / RQ-24) TaxID=649638 RepID=D7CUD2_TRURR|nr:aquaporin [Truepera radiovictrix]ADI15717.1 major intrinsic protein [Truepera radiovictrix DSM 17093]WMT58657.1 aquaporin [Truepera radiovictrix]